MSSTLDLYYNVAMGLNREVELIFPVKTTAFVEITGKSYISVINKYNESQSFQFVLDLRTNQIVVKECEKMPYEFMIDILHYYDFLLGKGVNK